MGACCSSPATEVFDKVPTCTSSKSLGDWRPSHLSAITTNHEEIIPASKSNSPVSRETAAAIKYIEKNANAERKPLVYINRIPVAVFQMKALTVPMAQNDVHFLERGLYNVVMDAYIAIHSQKIANFYPVLLMNTLDQAWFESLSDETDLGTSAEQMEADMVATAESFLGRDMVFIPMNGDRIHWYLIVLNFREGEYQILDSDEFPLQGYKLKLEKFRDGIDRCLEAAGKTNQEVAEMANYVASWELHKIEDIPKQMDYSSCGLYVLKYMQLWNGTKLVESFTQEDVELFRKKLAEELIFSELNEVQNVKEEIWWAM